MKGLVQPGNVELALRILLAAVVGGLIGLEREIRDQPAGLRTHVSVALGACLFGLISAYSLDQFVDSRPEGVQIQFDPTRIAAQVVVGVGFLGGGAILKQGSSVKGLTTAASMWVTSAIGLAAAFGEYFMVGATAIVLLVTLAALRKPRRWIRSRMVRMRETLIIRMPAGTDPSGIVTALGNSQHLSVRSLNVRDEEDARIIEVEVMGVRGHSISHDVERLSSREDVIEIEQA